MLLPRKGTNYIPRAIQTKNGTKYKFRAIHSGDHKNYSARVEKSLNKILIQGRAEKWAQKQYDTAIRKLTGDLRRTLENYGKDSPDGKKRLD